MPERTRFGSAIGARGTKTTPSGKVSPAVVGDRQGKAGLADAAGAEQGDERNIVPSGAGRVTAAISSSLPTRDVRGWGDGEFGG